MSSSTLFKTTSTDLSSPGEESSSNRVVQFPITFQAKKLINNPEDVVTEFIGGLVETYPGLQYLEVFPRVKIVTHSYVLSKTNDKVVVILEGGSGHELAHAQLEGEGMLTAAICGDVFASPSGDAILAGIRAATGPMGCLLILKNYSRDHLNFGLTSEQANSEDCKVEMVIVGDDCAHSGLIEEGQYYFLHMTEFYGIEAGNEHFGCMVDVLGRAGKLEKAKIKFLSMDQLNNSLLDILTPHFRNYDLKNEGMYKGSDHCSKTEKMEFEIGSWKSSNKLCQVSPNTTTSVGGVKVRESLYPILKCKLGSDGDSKRAIGVLKNWVTKNNCNIFKVEVGDVNESTRFTHSCKGIRLQNQVTQIVVKFLVHGYRNDNHDDAGKEAKDVNELMQFLHSPCNGAKKEDIDALCYQCFYFKIQKKIRTSGVVEASDSPNKLWAHSLYRVKERNALWELPISKAPSTWKRGSLNVFDWSVTRNIQETATRAAQTLASRPLNATKPVDDWELLVLLHLCTSLALLLLQFWTVLTLDYILRGGIGVLIKCSIYLYSVLHCIATPKRGWDSYEKSFIFILEDKDDFNKGRMSRLGQMLLEYRICYWA